MSVIKKHFTNLLCILNNAPEAFNQSNMFKFQSRLIRIDSPKRPDSTVVRSHFLTEARDSAVSAASGLFATWVRQSVNTRFTTRELGTQTKLVTPRGCRSFARFTLPATARSRDNDEDARVSSRWPVTLSLQTTRRHQL